MSRAHVLVAVVFSGAFAALCCAGQSSGGSETAVLAFAGTCSYAGFPGTNDFPAVRGFIRSDGVHEAAFRVAVVGGRGGVSGSEGITRTSAGFS